MNDYRPVSVLNDWLSRFGYGTRRTTGKDHLTLAYALISERGKDRWVPVGADKDGEKALSTMTQELWQMFSTVHRDGLIGDNVPRLRSLLVMYHGDGEVVVGREDIEGRVEMADKFDNLPDEVKGQISEAYPDMIGQLRGGRVPARLITAMTEEGIVTEATLFYPDQEPKVEVLEQWVNDGENTVPENRGPIERVLYKCFVMLSVIQNAVADGDDIEPEAIMKSIMRHPENPFARAGLGLMLELMAFGINNGLVEIKDLEGDDQ